MSWSECCGSAMAFYAACQSINQSIKFISNQIKKFDIQCTLCNIHGKLFYNKHVATFSISD